LEKNIKFSVEEVKEIDFDSYSQDKFLVAKTCFLSTAENSHGLKINEEILRRDAHTILGNFLVAKMQGGDATTHKLDEVIFGYFPKEQEIEFEEVGKDEDKIVKAYAFAVISKQYGKEFCQMFVDETTKRNTSVEMKVSTTEDSEEDVLSFDIFGLTCLGRFVNGSCPDANMSIVRFSEEDADNFFADNHKDKLSQLKTFAKERKQAMADEKKTYKVDKSKDAMSTKAWGDVDKNSMRDKIMEASNRASLVKDVYALVEPEWESAPSEHLKYPIMELEGDTFVYNRDALSSALGYAKKEDETAVVSKIEKIYKKLGLDSEGKEEEKKMVKEVEFAAVDIGDMWGKIWDALHARYPDGEYECIYRICGIYEEGNKKFAIIRRKDEDTKYRLDFSLTEEGLELAEEIIKVELEIKETDEVRKFAEPEDAKKFKKFEDEQDDDGDDDDEGKETEMSCDEMKAKMAQMQADIESRDNIIMEKDTELADLRAFKSSVEEKEKAMSVEAVMADIKEFVDDGKYKELRDEGLACEFAALDGWKNTARAVAFEASKGKTAKKSDGVWRMSGVIETPKAKNGLWD